MSTTTVVVIVVVGVALIVLAVMIGLRKRSAQKSVRPVQGRSRDDYGPVPAPRVSAADNYRETSVFDDDPDVVEEDLPRREPGTVWDDPEPFESSWPRRDRGVERRHRRAPMIRRDSEIGPDHELPEDDWAWPRASGGADVVQLDSSSTRDDSFVEPARCEPIAHPGPGTYPAQEVSSPADSGSARDDSGSAAGWSSSGSDSGSYGSSGDSGSSGSSGDSGSGNSGGCD